MSLDPNQPLLRDWLEYLEREVRKAGVEVRLETDVDRRAVEAFGPEVVVVATGAQASLPDIRGIDQDNVVTAEEVLSGAAQVGERVVVLGGLEDHLRPLTIADLLAGRGHDVEIVSELKYVGIAVENRTLHQLLKRLLERDVRLTPLTAVTAIDGRSLTTRNVITHRSGSIGNVDTLVVACGGRAVDHLLGDLRGIVPEVFAAGDAISPRRLIHAVLDGARVGRQI